MTVIDEIKERLRIEDEIETTVKLRRAGKNFTGLCPFHSNTNSPAFVVFPGTQTWRCFGACDEGGDIFTFVMKKNGWDFPEALRYLAGKAGVEVRPLNQEEQRKVELRRDREAVLSAAMLFFQSKMGLAPLNEKGEEPVLQQPFSRGLAYAIRERAFTAETVRAAGIGYFDDDWNGLREYLKSKGMDPESPAAVALVGYRGNVAEWAKKHGVILKADHPWISNSKIPAMPPSMLIYPHVVHGRVSYLAGRRLPAKETKATQAEGEANELPKSWNLPEDLAGPKQPMFNHHWWGAKAKPKKKDPKQKGDEKPGDIQPKIVVIVEGQANAITLAQWNLHAVALAGSAIPDAEKKADSSPTRTDNYLLSELKRRVADGNRILVGMDSDEAGMKARLKVIHALLEAGLTAVQIGIIEWPTNDANDWLQQGAKTSDLLRLLGQSRNYLSELIDAARPLNGQRDDEAVKLLFDALVPLKPFEVENHREEVCSCLGIRARMFDGLLKAARRDAGLNDDGGQRYFVEGGRIFTRFFDQAGGETIDALCNFAATIKEDVLRDDGQEVVREFRLAGEAGKKPLPEARVRADEFSKMDWVLKAWGSKAIIEAGAKRKDQLRAAIQHLSREVERRVIFTHTGWREVEGKRIYLSAAGAVGAEGIDVELDRDLELYNIPVVAENPAEAMKLSLSFLEIAPDRIAFPLWGAMWLPPLRDLVNVAFAMWVYGGTGTMKSTYCALALNHYGAGFDDKHLPSNFLDSANRMEQKEFVVKDAPLVIDDYAPQKDARSQTEYTRAVQRIVRGMGNLSGRGRLNADASAKSTYVPRSLVIITGEDLPESESLVARMFVVELNKGDVDKVKLSALQKQRARLAHAMSGYLTWAAENWPGWAESIPKQWRDYRQDSFTTGVHLRLPEAVAGLMLGIEMGLRYAHVLEAINIHQYNELKERGWAALTEGAKSMSERVKDEKPERLFLRTLEDLLTQGKIFFKAADGMTSAIGGPSDHADMLGWHDKDRLYLMPEAAYNRVSHHFRDQGNIFPVREPTLRKTLAEAGWIETDATGRRTQSIHLDGLTRRVMVLKRSALNSEQKEDGKEG